ncbi:MAG: hypothetical protein K6B52_05410 [Clostridiales bacterium]|nr:hypothetical protein [Clostridiales bacterium]
MNNKYKNETTGIDREQFKNPSSEFRGAPFWAWNCKLDKEELLRQIDIFKSMGFGGFHMHVRTGLATEYMSETYLEMIKACTEKAKEENMFAYLYDEDRWPSGSAGGIVTKDNKYRAKYLLITPLMLNEDENKDNEIFDRMQGGRKGEGHLLLCYDINLDENGFLKGFKKITEKDEPTGSKWFVYYKTHPSSSWFNNNAYIDPLSKEPVKRFIEETHCKYKKAVGSEFGKTVPSIFTDEPQFTKKTNLKKSDGQEDVFLPWTDGFENIYQKRFGENFFEILPELIWDKQEEYLPASRLRYLDLITELFADSFSKTIGDWCNENGIMFTGHMDSEPTLSSQNNKVGECMRSYPYFDIPGIDMLCRNFEFTTAKQCQSIVHQYGKTGMMSELYGVTGWDTDFRDYKLFGDWQAALGVTLRVPHLAWVSMEGEAKRDYPASIGYQSPWYEKYPLIENHFARINTLLTKGEPDVKIAVVHPIESYRLHCGPDDKTKKARDNADKRFLLFNEWMLKSNFDFDYISESLLPSQCKDGSKPLTVGKMKYDVVIVAECDTLRRTTLDILRQFKNSGGRLIFFGRAPALVDGEFSSEVKSLYIKSEVFQFDKDNTSVALENERTVKITDIDNKPLEKYIYQLRKLDNGKILFVSHCSEPDDKNSECFDNLKISVKGIFTPSICNTITGEIEKSDFYYDGDYTIIKAKLFSYDSLLVYLQNGEGKCDYKEYEESYEEIDTPYEFEYSLSEKNVLLLDIANYKLDYEEQYHDKDEILRIDSICREKIGMKRAGGNIAQPWTGSPETAKHSITFKFDFECEKEFENCLLAIERPDSSSVLLNGKTVDTTVTGFFTDKSIKTIKLPTLIKGLNTLEITVPLCESVSSEWFYILGDFAVRLKPGTPMNPEIPEDLQSIPFDDRMVKKILCSLPEKLSLGTVTQQGFPFYSGNITYKLSLNREINRIKIDGYDGTLVSCFTDDSYAGDIIYPPFELSVPQSRIISLTLYGNRVNSFGTVHRPGENREQGPHSWRTSGEQWTYDYNLRNIGIRNIRLYNNK